MQFLLVGLDEYSRLQVEMELHSHDQLTLARPVIINVFEEIGTGQESIQHVLRQTEQVLDVFINQKSLAAVEEVSPPVLRLYFDDDGFKVFNNHLQANSIDLRVVVGLKEILH